MLRLHNVKMSYCHRRMCPICGKQDLLKLSEHLRQVHKLSCEERQPYLKNVTFTQPFKLNLNASGCLETHPYPEFKFNHPAMMMIVGPTLRGK